MIIACLIGVFVPFARGCFFIGVSVLYRSPCRDQSFRPLRSGMFFYRNSHDRFSFGILFSSPTFGDVFLFRDWEIVDRQFFRFRPLRSGMFFYLSRGSCNLARRGRSFRPLRSGMFFYLHGVSIIITTEIALFSSPSLGDVFLYTTALTVCLPYHYRFRPLRSGMFFYLPAM